jgi:hypothetical protein
LRINDFLRLMVAQGRRKKPLAGAHAFRLIADQIGHLARVGAVSPPSSGTGHAQAVQRGAGANMARALLVVQLGPAGADWNSLAGSAPASSFFLGSGFSR